MLIASGRTWLLGHLKLFPYGFASQGESGWTHPGAARRVERSRGSHFNYSIINERDPAHEHPLLEERKNDKSNVVSRTAREN